MVPTRKFNIPTAREIFKSFKNVRGEWKSRTPMQKWCYFYGIAQTISRFLCHPILDDLNDVHWFAYAIVVYSFVLILLSLYTLCYYGYRGQMQMALPSTCVAFICLGVSSCINFYNLTVSQRQSRVFKFHCSITH